MEEEKQFLCGVVEGFYGRPWSMDQRKVLFQWMQLWGLNTYLYGPKDDLKHRLLWREVYSPEEEAQLRTLIAEAQSRGLRFVYALSPGQDIVFSSSCDLALLKRKLKQVSDLGCQAFAILFDDIDHSMCQADSEAFTSFAHAQVTVANEIYRFLGEPPVFLFCPTEYCGSLCSPSVSKSPYLQTVGEDLLHNITVIWTGSKVISRKLSLDSLAELESVLQRPPLIWDNLHANDYDTRRLFLGPFKGRDPQLRNHLRGLLLNPNCEFEANYIPLHTLGSWHRAEKDYVKDPASVCESCGNNTLAGVTRAKRSVVCLQGSYWAIDTNPKEDALPTRPKKRPRSGERASTPYSLDSESLGMDCMISGSASPTLAINTVTNKVALYNTDQEGSDSPRSSLNNSLSDQSLASVNLNSVGSVHSYTPVRTMSYLSVWKTDF
ncbi:protein O-GlcNAcase-like [Xiphophorus hellerii]|uniref:protein O-GlcNAcase-like n=1 Tax=Xiphophorus hellerii TaxID=8084 RepID=UPI0013B46CAF|nr:protein O-GlcNAcase-like [Xiphophorus hellerii]